MGRAYCVLRTERAAQPRINICHQSYMTTINLSIPESLHASVCAMAEREGISLEQFIMLAMAEKASAIATEAFLATRAEQGSKEKFLAAMSKVADVESLDERDRM